MNSWLLVAAVWPGIVLYLLVFPTGALPSRRWRPVGFAVLALAAVGVGATGGQTPEGEPITNPLALADAASMIETVFAVVSLAFAAALILAVVSVVLRFRRASPDDRQALRWLVVVAVLSASLLVVAIGAGALGLHQIGDPFGVAFLLSVVIGLPLSAAIALLGHHLRGIEVVANRSIVYGALAAVVTAIYAVVVGVAGALAGGGDRPNVLAAVAATALAAVAFQPARRRAHRLADRIVYGDRASPYELVATFTERLDEASLTDILPRMANLVAEGTGAQRVGIWLQAGGELHAVAGWPSTRTQAAVRVENGDLPGLGAGHAFAVRDREDLRGAISVEMPPQEPMTPATERLLSDLSGQAALVLRNIALVEELQRSRQRLVASQDEERRRLERDLHDGAQQRLVTLSMDLRMARERADARGDVELTTRLATAEQEPARSIAELRNWRADPPGDPDADRVGRRRPIAGRTICRPCGGAVPSRTPLLARGRGDGLLLRVRGVGERSQARASVFGVGRRRGWRRAAHHRGGRRRRRWRGDERGLRPSRPGRPRGGGGREDRSPQRSGGRDDAARRDPVRVVVADDAVLFREGLARLLTDAGFDVVGQAADADELLAIIREAPTDRTPDVAVVDIRMPPSHTTEGLVAAKTIRAEDPDVGVLVLSQYVETEHAMDLLGDGTGGTGYLLKDRVSDLDGFRDAVRRVGEGGSAVDPEVIAQLVHRRRAVDPIAELTEREREVLGLMAEGCSNRAIGTNLSLSEKTVEAHVRGIFTKLGLLPAPDENRRVLAVLAFLRSD